MVLNGKYLICLALDTLGGVIEQIDVCYLQPCVFQRLCIDGIAVVLAGNVYLACLQVFYGMVAAAVSELHFVALGSVSQTYHLQSEADTENRYFASQLFYQLYDRRG